MCIPALLYAVQGNLLYFGMDRLSPPVYTISYQLKILTTALLSVLLLGKKLGPVKWCALALLMIGVSMVQLQESADDLSAMTTSTINEVFGQLGSSVKGLIAVLFASFTSGLAGVYLEKMLTQSSTSIWMRNVQLGSIGAVMALVTALANDSAKILHGGFLQGFTYREVALVFWHCLAGLCSAAVIKHAGNILKCFAAAITVVLTTSITALTTRFFPDRLFQAGVTLVIVAVFVYNLGLPTCAHLWTLALGKACKRLKTMPQGKQHTS